MSGDFDSIFDSVSDKIERSVNPENPEAMTIDFSHLGFKSIPFSKENFHLLTSTPQNSDPKSMITFIDGGNAELFSSSSACLSFIRVVYTSYRDNKRLVLKKDEFFCLVTTKTIENALTFSAILFPTETCTLTDSFFTSTFNFSPDDPSLSSKGSRLSISAVPGIIRRFAELSTATLMASNARPGDSIIIDGSLESHLPDEKKLMDALKTLSTSNNITVAGLCKTSELLTSDGRSPIFLLSSLAPVGSWFYFPAIEAYFDLYFTKLHPDSDYIFRLDTLTPKDTSQLFNLLQQNSTDPVFLGYPYGLVEADRFARVSNNEKEYLTTTFFTRAGAKSKTIELLKRTLDAHSVLDHIS